MAGTTWIFIRREVERSKGGMAMVLLCLISLLTTTCMAELSFYTESNISTQHEYISPKCAQLCFPFPANVFIDQKVPCAEHEGDVDKWVPCLCTHRPFLRFIVDCVFHKCGPAIVAAFEFGYHICADYNITFPPPKEAIVDLNITVLYSVIAIPDTIPDMPLPFSKELPPPQDGGSTSDENPPLNLNLSMQSTAWRGREFFLENAWRDASRLQLRLAMILVWTAMVVSLGGGFVGLL